MLIQRLKENLKLVQNQEDSPKMSLAITWELIT